jgi:TRAP-type mannitol/chloroaromatic compound transport system permease small subunit
MSEFDVDAALDNVAEAREELNASSHAEAVDLELTESKYFRGIHPVGWVAAGVLALAAIYHTVLNTKYLIGNFGLSYWLFFVAIVALAVRPVVLHRIRLGIEGISTITKSIAWVLAWAVFFLQLFNVVTRYSNEYINQDILFGQVVSLAWQSFGLIFLLGANYGVRDGVNPRIDFWWADFKPKTKAWLDFSIHVVLLFPFIWMAYRILQPYAATSLGRKRNGDWESGFRVWETWEQSGNAGELPLGPIKAMLVVSFVLFGLQIIAEIIKTGFVMMGNKEYGELKEADAPLRIE